jgi:hypothetical protein
LSKKNDVELPIFTGVSKKDRMNAFGDGDEGFRQPFVGEFFDAKVLLILRLDASLESQASFCSKRLSQAKFAKSTNMG